MRIGLPEAISSLEGHDCSTGCSATVALLFMQRRGFKFPGTAADAVSRCKTVFSNDLWEILMTAAGSAYCWHGICYSLTGQVGFDERTRQATLQRRRSYDHESHDLL